MLQTACQNLAHHNEDDNLLQVTSKDRWSIIAKTIFS